MIEINIKPLSVNKAYEVVRSTEEHKQYKIDLPLLLPEHYQLPPGELVLLFRFHFKRPVSDLDNPIKQAQDIITSYYGCDDREIYMLMVEKVINFNLPEKLEFEYLSYTPDMFSKCREVIINCD